MTDIYHTPTHTQHTTSRMTCISSRVTAIGIAQTQEDKGCSSLQATVTLSGFKHTHFSRSEPKQTTSCRDLKPPLDWFSQVSRTSQVCNSTLRLKRYQIQFLIVEVIYAVVQGALLSIRLFGCVDKWALRGTAAIPCLSTVN
jgi:hypothetical protein